MNSKSNFTSECERATEALCNIAQLANDNPELEQTEAMYFVTVLLSIEYFDNNLDSGDMDSSGGSDGSDYRVDKTLY